MTNQDYYHPLRMFTSPDAKSNPNPWSESQIKQLCTICETNGHFLIEQSLFAQSLDWCGHGVTWGVGGLHKYVCADSDSDSVQETVECRGITH